MRSVASDSSVFFRERFTLRSERGICCHTREPTAWTSVMTALRRPVGVVSNLLGFPWPICRGREPSCKACSRQMFGGHKMSFFSSSQRKGTSVCTHANTDIYVAILPPDSDFWTVNGKKCGPRNSCESRSLASSFKTFWNRSLFDDALRCDSRYIYLHTFWSPC